ncbi:MAG: MaoC family dehydratase [Prolixibacteraceae bacterium]|nr:MaoC family dehydratase [Prolixibacteraceae bacterium]MBN2773758.1 MaoC family dehydratase [Prolixibacteraceae bacterium]
MEKVIIDSHEEFEKYLGKEIGASEYLTITQEQINKFAEATLDYQWIHTNPEKAAKESPFKNTIAHGYLTLSLLAHFWDEIVEVRNYKMLVNYGLDKLKFNQPVIVNSAIRARVWLNDIKNLRGITRAQMKIIVDIKGNEKPAYETLVTFLYHFNN